MRSCFLCRGKIGRIAEGRSILVVKVANKSRFWCTTEIKVEGEKKACKITSTPGHKYFLPENTVDRDKGARLEHESYKELGVQWVSAENLKKGDKVLLSDGKYGIVVGVKFKMKGVVDYVTKQVFYATGGFYNSILYILLNQTVSGIVTGWY
jgi:hypothetical protein